tara:strand:+ start:316 stop:1032 length:717 start_codon:yes stop_codon:yes gene_type:complete
MDRRKSIQTIILGAGAAGLALHGCTPEGDSNVNDAVAQGAEKYFGRTPKELERLEKLNAEQLFTEHELATIAALSTVILPPKEPHGGPIEAGVPEFIEFMGKDVPTLQTTLLGGLMWLDHKSNTEFETEFKSATLEQQKSILDPIAFHDMEVPLDEQALEIQFFYLMRGLTMTGYYTSKVGIEDLGYKGNQPNVWDGVPQDVLDQHGVAYDPEWIAKCVDQSKRGVIAEWDENGNLLT